MHVSFGVSIGAILLQREDTQQFMDLVKMADGYGVEALGTYDAAFLGGDTFERQRHYMRIFGEQIMPHFR